MLALTLLAFLAIPPLAGAQRQLTFDIYKQLIEINTTESSGNMTTAAEAMAKRLTDAGFPADDVKVLVPEPRHGNLVARLRGTGKEKPLLLLAHLDVVEARREDWSTDPFLLIEKDGYYYGRGTGDDKAMAAIWIATLIRLKQEHFVPDRDLIVALTSDEETGDYNGVDWLVKNHRDLIDAAFALNEGGGGAMKNGKYLYNGVGASEKVYITLRLEVKNPGGHSSLPREPNAIYQLADALEHVHAYQFPVKLNEITRAYFARMAAFEEGQVASDMRALAEHADNALPQTARATINCRVLPGEDPEAVRTQIVNAIHDPAVEVTWIDRAKLSVPSPLSPAAMKPIEEVTHEFWPDVIVVPTMATGASDGLYLRNAGIPTYGVSGLFGEIGESRSHGRDERVGVQQFYESAQFLYSLVRRLSK
jgi:acetylornithine deacetylase/succinyl-diaminopimelate desuccinylase-like protein